MVSVGKRYGKLTVIGIGNPYIRPSGAKENRWRCLCDCGEIKDIVYYHLSNGKTVGCARVLGAQRFKTHGMSKTRLHNCWFKMKA